MPRKSKGQRKNTSPFCSKRKRRKFPDLKEFDADEKQVLASSDLSSWFSQEQQWTEKFNDSAASAITEGDSTTASASKRKLEESKKTLLANNCANESDTSDLESLHSSSEDEEVDEACSVFSKPTGNYIVCPDNLEQMLYAKFVTVSCILWKSLVQNKVLGPNGTFVAPMSYVYHVRPVSSSQFRLSPIKYTMLTVHQLLVFELSYQLFELSWSYSGLHVG
jgi:endogenous inhibitor of DNA gyrase (YacG/DUF329 family)